jgi:hypothetical protein
MRAGCVKIRPLLNEMRALMDKKRRLLNGMRALMDKNDVGMERFERFPRLASLSAAIPRMAGQVLRKAGQVLRKAGQVLRLKVQSAKMFRIVPLSGFRESHKVFEDND